MKSLVISNLLLCSSALAQFGSYSHDGPYFGTNPSSSCVSNLWQYPIEQSMVLLGGDATSLATNGYGCQKIHNTSSTDVTIKAARIWTQWSDSTFATVYAKCRTSFNTTLGSDIGVASQSFTTNNTNPNGWVVYTWPVGSEPTIPANTDFYVGIVNTGAANKVSVLSNFMFGGASYEDSNYSSYANNAIVDSADDLMFQLYICEANNNGLDATTNTLLTGLVGYWKFDESGTGNRADATGNGWTATNRFASTIDAVAASKTPFIGANAVYYPTATGQNQALDVSANIDTRASTTPFTAQLWMFGNGTGSGVYLMGAWGDSLSVDQWMLNFGSDIRTPVLNSVSTGNTLSGATWSQMINTLRWNHYVFGYDGANIWIQVNARTRVTTSASNVRRGVSTLTFGHNSFGQSSINTPLNTINDEAAYWNRTLSTNEVTILYNGGAGLPFSSFH